MKTTVITGLILSALLVCGLVVVVHMALSSGIGGLDFGGTL